jgi:transaldolase
MKLFVDTANLEELDQALQRGFPCGVTTNPSILAKEHKRDFRRHINEMIGLLVKHGYDIPLSVEVFTTDPHEMIVQAEEFMVCFGHYPNLNIKVPIGWNELAVIHELRRRNIKVNCTCCMSYNQAMMAARAGANYVSVFWGRIRDIGYDASSIVRQVHLTLRGWNSTAEIIVGSIRHIADINEAMMAGADIITVPPKFFPQLCAHPKTDEAVLQFVTDFQKCMTDVLPLRQSA